MTFTYDYSTDQLQGNPRGMTRCVVLVGLMGAGKSTVGRRLARALSVPFRDSDEEIVEAAGCSIPDIFALYGEEKFRDLERRVLLRLLKEPPCVLATGGGAFMQAPVRDAVLDHGIAVWLKAELDVLVDRVSRRNTRPLLETGDKKDIMRRLMEERYPVYAQAHITIDSNDGPHEAVVERALAALRTHGAFGGNDANLAG